MSKNTVFVIGAGASKEVNLPSGHELKSRISKLLDIRFDDFKRHLKHGDQLIVSALRKFVEPPRGKIGDISPYLPEAWHIRDALPLAISIDNFLDAHKDNSKIALCGKLAIVRSILQAERSSLLYFEKQRKDSTIDFVSLETTWYLPFFQLLTENCGIDDLKNRFQLVTLIVFNYDRCIEHFLYHALQKYYRIAEKEAATIVNQINLYHPYGCVGQLPWSTHSGSMDFGADPSSEQLLQLSNKIKTFAEGTDPGSSEITEIRRHMSIADRLVFIGFAFHKLNMQLIKPEKVKKKPVSFATTYRISKSDRAVIGTQISDLYRPPLNIKMENLTCTDFLMNSGEVYLFSKTNY